MTSAPTDGAMNIDEVAMSSVSAPVQPARRVGRSRRTITSRFKGFDDDFDMPTLPESLPDGQAQAPAFQTESLFISQSQGVESEQQPSESVVTRTRSSRKRPDPPIEEDDENDEDVLDQLAPAAANLKRRRLADEIARRRKGEPSPPRAVIAGPETKALTKKSKKVKVEIDVLEIARQRREKEEEIARAEREALQEAVDGMDIDQIRNLAIIEDMDVKRSAPPPGAGAHGDEGDRWDERWNGRKNFKKFRRGEGGPRVLNKVIVPLEEVKKKDFGIGDEYWLEGDKNTTKKKRGKERARETQSMGPSQSQATPVRRQAHEINDADETGKVDLPTSSQRATTRSQKLTDKTNVSPNRPSQNKRAAEPLAKPASAKKARQAARRQDSDDSEDGLGFRFRKKK
jgi:nibrin